ncbi:MAG: polyribonucleotide nucleotidyltransferase [Deferribacteres bacterium]|nr:polyribonucleotide nucleotidyltransferase [candidate division KSB1 bacterium]MCB9512385.1 polyribonucleotide nucleotidyltransferase [Deferribacteres bacterium]
MMVVKETTLNNTAFNIETGRVARQANGSVLVTYGETVLLATAVASEEATDRDFFPLSVEYREKGYAAGKIPGGYIKREGRPSEKEILSSRLIDRGLRPLFADGFRNEIQIIVTVLSADKENFPDVVGITAASAALSLSDIPWMGPIAGIRVGRVDDEFVANPSASQLEESDIDLIMAVSEDSILMVEGESDEISEEDMLAALEFGQKSAQALIELQKQLVSEAGKAKVEFALPGKTDGLEDRVKEEATSALEEFLKITEKADRRSKIKAFSTDLKEKLAEEFPECEKEIASVLHDIEKDITRSAILNESRRLDGRGPDDIRDISCEVGMLPRTHGSCLFTRGQTQSLGVVTLGTKVDEQRMDELDGEYFKTYMLHYNFPPFSVGEVRPIRGVGRREIGHGDLAERALKPVIPREDVFPYTIRIVSEILESNGSSSMASVCSGSLALMDAGVPVKEAVAGIAMGLITDGSNFKVLTDILGDEDHLGDMDFKVAGTASGITAFQMDIKVKGISTEVMEEALQKAQNARLRILEVMNATLNSPREDLSEHAPRIISFKINPENIGTVIGPGGKVIRDIVEKSGATVDISDDGTVKIAAVDPRASQIARTMIDNLVAEPEVGAIYKGKVTKIATFGAFVEIMPGKEGLLHISEIDTQRINRVEDVLNVGDEVEVKLLRAEKGKWSLSRKVLLGNDE